MRKFDWTVDEKIHSSYVTLQSMIIELQTEGLAYIWKDNHAASEYIRKKISKKRINTTNKYKIYATRESSTWSKKLFHIWQVIFCNNFCSISYIFGQRHFFLGTVNCHSMLHAIACPVWSNTLGYVNQNKTTMKKCYMEVYTSTKHQAFTLMFLWYLSTILNY